MLVEITDRIGFVPGGTNVGVLRLDERHVALVDTGLNDTTARKVLRAVRDDLASEVVAIVNTHGHADHFGANAFVIKRTGAQVIAPAIEATVIEHPVLQPALLFGGADPADALRSRFLLAEPSPVNRELRTGAQDLEGLQIEVIPLEGHSPNQIGIVAEEVFFCADVVFPQAAIDKHRIPYLYGLTTHLASVERATKVEAKTVVPGHGPHAPSIGDLATANRWAINRVIEHVVEALAEPRSADDVSSTVFVSLGVPVSDAQSYYLLRPTIQAYLAHLERLGEVQLMIDKGRALWSRT